MSNNAPNRYLKYLFPAIQGGEVTVVNSGQQFIALPLNGSLKDRSGGNQISFIQDGYSRSLSFKTGADLSVDEVTFIVHGLQNGVFVTEEIQVGKNEEVPSANCWDVITSITPTANFNGNLSINSGPQGWILFEMDPALTSLTALQIVALNQDNVLTNAVLTALDNVVSAGQSVNDLIKTNIGDDGNLGLLPNSFFGINQSATANMTYTFQPFGGFFSVLVAFGFTADEVLRVQDGYTVMFSQN